MPPIFNFLLSKICPAAWVTASQPHWPGVFHWAATRYDELYSKHRRTTPKPIPMAKEACFARLHELVDSALTSATPRPERLPDMERLYGRNDDNDNEDSVIAELWRPAVIDALTVHVVSSKKVNVAIPMNWYLFRRLDLERRARGLQPLGQRAGEAGPAHLQQGVCGRD